MNDLNAAALALLEESIRRKKAEAALSQEQLKNQQLIDIVKRDCCDECRAKLGLKEQPKP